MIDAPFRNAHDGIPHFRMSCVPQSIDGVGDLRAEDVHPGTGGELIAPAQSRRGPVRLLRSGKFLGIEHSEGDSDPMATILRRRSIGVTVIVVTTVGLLCACSNDGGKTVSMEESRKEAQAIRQAVFDVAGSRWPDSSRKATPAPTVCTFDGDTHGGVQLHYRGLGSPPADPRAYIEAVSRVLRDRDMDVSTS